MHFYNSYITYMESVESSENRIRRQGDKENIDPKQVEDLTLQLSKVTITSPSQSFPLKLLLLLTLSGLLPPCT
jgi:hypothetical protein